MFLRLGLTLRSHKYSDADKKVFDQIKTPIDNGATPNLAKWYNNVKAILADPVLLEASLQGQGIGAAGEKTGASGANGSKQEHGNIGEKKKGNSDVFTFWFGRCCPLSERAL